MPHAHQQSSSITARCAIITLSDTRTESTDKSGSRILDLLTSAHHTIGSYQVIPDDPAQLDTLLTDLLKNPNIDLVITNGGTGISPRDNTIPVIQRHLTVPLPGFGELFRMLSYEQVQSAAMLSRALAGVAGADRDKLLFALPGSTKAVELAMTRLILPELAHLLTELRK